MGLGKTVETLAVINCNPRAPSDCRGKYIDGGRTLYRSKATLVIAPVSLVGQWERECVLRSTVPLKLKRYYASYRKRDIELYRNEDIVFTTYGILAKENGLDARKHVLHSIDWHRIILDESHCIKNPQTLTSRSIQLLRGTKRWLLTGTPFGRQIYDIANQLRFLGLSQRHCDALNLKRLKGKMNRNTFADSKVLPILKLMKRVVIRHKKAQTINGSAIVRMPAKHEEVVFFDFTPEQRKWYTKMYAIAEERFAVYKTTGNIGRGAIAILSALNMARQACSGQIYSTRHIEAELEKARVRKLRVAQLVDAPENANKTAQELYELALVEAFNVQEAECAICYEAPFDDPLQTVCGHMFCGECIRTVLSEKSECPMCRETCKPTQLRKPPATETAKETPKGSEDSDTKEQTEESAPDLVATTIKFDLKLNWLISEIQRLNAAGENEKSLIFTSFGKSLEWICGELDRHTIAYRTLSGSMSMNNRKRALQQFSDDSDVKVFVLTVRSGAVGITLTAANHVYLLEPPFNPALYRQAINRAYRLGQRREVHVHTLIMRDSIEERIWNINKEKVAGEGEGSKGIAGNINNDKRCKLKPYEIEKLFE